MTVRTTETHVTFRQPFTLTSFDRVLPAGTYRVVMDEEEISGLTFLAFRHTATMLHVPAVSSPYGTHEVFDVDPDELRSALVADGRC
jgi:hypothetical protein